MSKWGHYIKSSFSDLRCCDDDVIITDPVTPGVVYAWRAVSTSITCVLDDGDRRTGYAHVGTLEKYDTSTGIATGDTKSNLIGDSDYIADYIDLDLCGQPVINPPSGNSTLTVYNNVAENHCLVTLTPAAGTTYKLLTPANQVGTKSMTNQTYTVTVETTPGSSWSVIVNGNLVSGTGSNLYLAYGVTCPIRVDVNNSSN